MILGERIAQLREESALTQRELSEASGLAVSYLSRLENNHVNPSVGTLRKVSEALNLPLSLFFNSQSTREPHDRCPVSLSGSCILDLLFIGTGNKRKINVESYSAEQMEILRDCNRLIHRGDAEILTTLRTTIRALMVLSDPDRPAKRLRSRT